MGRWLELSLLALVVSVMMARTAAAQAPEIKGWDRIKFGMTWKQLQNAYPAAEWNEKHTAVIIGNPVGDVAFAICQFSLTGCSAITLILNSTDLAAVVRSVQKKRGPPRSHEKRLGGDWCVWADSKGAVICVFPITSAWLAQSGLGDTGLASHEGRIATFYSQKGGLRP